MTSPAFDLINLDALRNDPRYRAIEGESPNPSQRLTVAVLDTGIEGSHDLLRNNFVAYVDFVQDEFNGGQRVVHTDPRNTEDPNGHGTHVAGTIGSTNPDIGVAPGVDLIGLRVLGSGQNGQELTEALQWVLDNRSAYNMDILSASVGDDTIALPIF